MAVRVKVCGITREADGLLARALGAHYLGINVYPKSPRSVSKKVARDLCQRFEAGTRVFVDVNTGTDELEDWADLGFDKFQIHCDYDTALVSVAAWSGMVGRENLWLAPKWPPGEPFPQMILEFCDTVVIDAFSKDAYGGTGKTANWERFAEVATLYQHKQFILAGGLSPENVREAIAQSGTSFVDVNSGVESAPGLKDPQKLKKCFEAVTAIG